MGRNLCDSPRCGAAIRARLLSACRRWQSHFLVFERSVGPGTFELPEHAALARDGRAYAQTLESAGLLKNRKYALALSNYQRLQVFERRATAVFWTITVLCLPLGLVLSADWVQALAAALGAGAGAAPLPLVRDAGVILILVWLVAFAANLLIKVSGLVYTNTNYFIHGLAELDRDVRRFKRKSDSPVSMVDVEPDYGLPYVLYLRSFDADSHGARVHGWLTEEEQLAEALTPIGRVIAVGRPGERLPSVGATRLYFADREWQGNVARLIADARLVVIRAGQTPGLIWEAQWLAAHAAPQRVLLLGEGRAAMLGLLNAVRDARGMRKKRFVRRRGPRIGTVGFAMRFDVAWSARSLVLHRGTFRALDWHGPYIARFSLALRPVTEQLNAEYRPPPYKSAVRIALGVVGFMLVFFLLIVLKLPSIQQLP